MVSVIFYFSFGLDTERLFNFCMCRDDHPEIVFSSMQNIMIVLLEESEDVQEHLLLILLSKLGRNRSVSILTLLTRATDFILI